MTFDEIIKDANDGIVDKSTAGNLAIAKGINAGLTRLRAKLKRNWTNVTRRFDIIQGQSVYQMPENAIRFGSVKFIDSNIRDPLHYVDDENEWDQLKNQVNDTGRPSMVRMLSNDLFEIYPAPGNNAIGEIKYQARAKALSGSDYTTGTVSVQRGSNVVTGTSTTIWDVTMIDKMIKLTTPGDTSDYYRIIGVDTSVSSAPLLYIENSYDGQDESGKAYRIGMAPDLPEEYHPSLSDYGLYYFYLLRKDMDIAREFQGSFLQSLAEIQSDYSTGTTSNVIESRKVRGYSQIPQYKRAIGRQN